MAGFDPSSLAPEMLDTMRDYVTAGDCEHWTRLPDGMVILHVTHSNLKRRMIELRFDKHMTIAEVKSKLHRHAGTPPQHQRLILMDAGSPVGPLDDDSKMLGYYSVTNGMEIHVVDEDPFSMSRGGGLENEQLIEKYRMSEDDYDQRKGTVREWIREQKAKDPNWKPPKPKMSVGLGGPQVNAPPPEPEGPPPGPESVEGMSVGARCEVMPGKRRRSVGTRGGKTYFECAPGFGSFIRPKNVECGDFPERDLLDEEDEDEEDDEL